ncbi:FkbM family methyltransferase [Phyllobacterium endophyticum]|uniref:FkbM family methyltransferase n=1 Tax=Phyllobacterium endophyticum TaxID=1149773 RepID=A0A2P7ANW2_9HYPH|nr:FkbM family methyltransferase [Phyllobacterium endophyticum]MBB3233755.1 FkbM family methyltransferase [Phyllobacterium endophyticum]PSH55903.1 FkbM family methyltransferase [Phyllobacterium endophyticum]TYR41045.1 FkbM family methyltransferase [Phyllobacterium endophyticum]
MLRLKSIRRHLRETRNNWSRMFFDTRYGRELLVSSLGPRVQTITLDCGDHFLTFSPNDYIGRKVFRKGHFEREHVDRLIGILKERRLLQEGTTVLELGGNIGTQTVYFALSGHFGRIISVEPDPRNFALLRANVAQNKLEHCVITINCAAGERSGEIDFFQHQNNHGKSSASRKSAKDCKIVVPVKSVGSILDESGTDFNEVGLVWMDIEGYEPVACRSMQPLLARRTPVYMEFSPEFYGARESAAFVQYLAKFYDECLIFHEGVDRSAKVKDIPVNEKQFDVLLFDSTV